LKEYNDVPLPVEYVFSVDCNFVPKDFDHKEDTLLLYKYTNTPVNQLEEWLLPKLANPVPENREESEGSYKYLQDNIDIFVVQSPAKDEDFHRIVKMLTDMLKYVVVFFSDSEKIRYYITQSILRYDKERGLKKQKRVIMYGQTNTQTKSKRKRWGKRRSELERVRITSEAGIYYVPLYEEERIGHQQFGVKHEKGNYWHFMDTGQHFITQVFFNILKLSWSCPNQEE